MNILLLGGGGFIGRHTALALLAKGYRVSSLQRGDGAVLPPGVQRLQGDRDQAMPALAGGPWDACVDICGYLPRALRESCTALAGVRRYVYVSAVRVYGDPTAGPVTEDFPRIAPASSQQCAIGNADEIDDASYGPLKVACEDVVQAAFADRATLLRPQVVAGPGDTSGRVAHWQARPDGPFPGDGSDWLQFVDVRDMAHFVAMVIERDLGGAFNLAGPRLRWRDFVEALGVVRPRWAPVDKLDMRSTPLYRPAGTHLAALMDVSSARAQAAGFRPRPAQQTVRDAAAAGALNAARASCRVIVSRSHVMRKLVTVRKVDKVKKVDDYEVLVIDGVEVGDYHSPRDLFHAGEYCVVIEAGVTLPAKAGRPWTPAAKTAHVEIYPPSAFPEIFEEMMMLAHDHDGFTTEDYLQIRDTDFARRLGVVEAG